MVMVSADSVSLSATASNFTEGEDIQINVTLFIMSNMDTPVQLFFETMQTATGIDAINALL